MKLVSFLILHANSTFSGVRCACVDVVLLIVGCCRNALKFNKFSLDGSFVYFLFFLFFWQVKKRFRKHQKNHSIALHELKQTTKRTNTHPHVHANVMKTNTRTLAQQALQCAPSGALFPSTRRVCEHRQWRSNVKPNETKNTEQISAKPKNK